MPKDSEKAVYAGVESGIAVVFVNVVVLLVRYAQIDQPLTVPIFKL